MPLTNSVHIIKWLTSTKHATDVSMPLVKTLVYNRADEERAMKQQPLILLTMILFSDLLTLVLVTLQKLFISDFLNLLQPETVTTQLQHNVQTPTENYRQRFRVFKTRISIYSVLIYDVNVLV